MPKKNLLIIYIHMLVCTYIMQSKNFAMQLQPIIAESTAVAKTVHVCGQLSLIAKNGNTIATTSASILALTTPKLVEHWSNSFGSMSS